MRANAVIAVQCRTCIRTFISFEKTAGRVIARWENKMEEIREGVPHSSHWGAFSARVWDGSVEITPHPRDLDPSPLLANIPAAVAHPARIAGPVIRRGWLE